MPDQLAQIEKMLAEGKTEEQILAAFGVAPKAATPEGRIAAGSAMGAQRIGPEPKDTSSALARFAKQFMGVVNPKDMSFEEEKGTLPLPFTENRLKPGDAAMGAMGVASGVQMLRALPAFARNLLSEAAPGAFKKAVPSAMHYGTKAAPAIEEPAKVLRFGVRKPPVPSVEPPVEQFPSPLREWLAESTAGTPSPGAMGVNPEFPFTPDELLPRARAIASKMKFGR